MENGIHSDIVVATVRKSIALEVLAGYLFLAATAIAFALASGPAQLLLAILWLVMFMAFSSNKSHHNERLHYGLYVGNDSKKSADGKSDRGNA